EGRSMIGPDTAIDTSAKPVNSSERANLSGTRTEGVSPPRISEAVFWYKLGLEIGRQRRILAHQGDGDAPVRRQRRIVGKQRLAVGLTGNREDVGRRKPFMF